MDSAVVRDFWAITFDVKNVIQLKPRGFLEGFFLKIFHSSFLETLETFRDGNLIRHIQISTGGGKSPQCFFWKTPRGCEM